MRLTAYIEIDPPIIQVTLKNDDGTFAATIRNTSKTWVSDLTGLISDFTLMESGRGDAFAQRRLWNRTYRKGKMRPLNNKVSGLRKRGTNDFLTI